MPEALALQMEEREVRVRVVGVAPDCGKQLRVPLEQGGVETDFVPLEIARLREPQHRQQHAGLVRACPAGGAVDVEGAEGVEVVGEGGGHGGR